jgi:hypothetical protein
MHTEICSRGQQFAVGAEPVSDASPAGAMSNVHCAMTPGKSTALCDHSRGWD